MKRMIFIRIALSVKQGGLKALLVVAAMTFMGTLSVSAQSYFTPSQAVAVTEATLTELSQSTPSKTIQPSSTPAGNVTPAQSAVVTNPSISLALKVSYLMQVKINLKMGLGTQAAIEQVYNNLAPNANGSRIILLGAAKTYVVGLLSN
ncbi:MAG: hypothetical protein ABIO24_04345 [Saprospiraceae bacterium]